MKRTLGAIILAIAMVTVVAPTAAAAGSSSTSDEVTAVYPTPTVTSTHRYRLNLTADTTLDAELTWANENADLDLILTEPGGTCQVLPNPDIMCLGNAAVGNAMSAACQNGSGQGETFGLGPGTETISTTADGHDSGEGEYSLWVATSTAVPFTSVAYDLTVTTGDDGHEDLQTGPEPFGLIRSSGHCR